MEAMNIEERKSAKWKFSIIFAVTLLIIALCGSISIVTAQKAIALLENKKSEYDEVFKNQANSTLVIMSRSNSERINGAYFACTGRSACWMT